MYRLPNASNPITMRHVIYFILVLLFFGCDSSPSTNQIMGKWEIKSWVNLRSTNDYLKKSGAPHFSVNFKVDTVYILEKENNKIRDYKFPWNLSNDTLRIKSLGEFHIEYLANNKLILTVKGTKLFS